MAFPLTVPTIGSTNWGISVNNNWNLLNSLIQGGGKNLIHNGSFDIWQRGVGFAAANVYTADRWKANAGTSANVSVTQTGSTSSPFVSQYALNIGCVSGASSYAVIGQQIEYNDFYLMLGTTMTVSFWAIATVNTSTSKALTLRYRIGTTTKDAPVLFSGTNTDYSITLSTSWQFFTQQITIPTTALGFSLEFGLFGSPVLNDGFSIALVQLEPGSINTPFMYEPFASLLATCQRFYEKSFLLTTTPGSNIQANSICTNCTNGGFNNSYAAAVTYKITKRILPTVTFYNPRAAVANTWTFYAGGVATSVTPTFEIQGTNSFTAVVGGTSTYSLVYIHYTADCDF
jgi:hypothetical protein